MEDENAVAVIGIACRFPGADDTDEFWENLKEGKCFIDEVPEERWNVDKADVKDADISWKKCASHAALISDHDKWDNKFFGISDTEAEWINPQHCFALEVTHSALENAGLTMDKIKGSKTSVYIGVMNDDMSVGLHNARHEYDNFVVTGMAQSITSNRISYFYDLRGPSMTLDTACSSALVAVHLGCQSIRTGESEIAICGGVNCIISPLNFIPLSKAKMISPTGKSHAFSKDADGYVRGEGCGIVILKKYSKALRDGDRIWSLIATGCNQDGHTYTPITAPSSLQQQSLLKEVYAKYEIDPGRIQYIEAHGTGTPVGDPIEVKALATFFGQYIEKGKFIPIGSVKTNIGHLESSAGTAGLIKTILMMHHGKIVPSLHFHSKLSNPAIEFNKISLKVTTSLSEWEIGCDGKRIACVNSFGFGGTNCHAILVRHEIQRDCLDNSNHSNYLIALSGKSLPALKNTLDHMLYQRMSGTLSLADVSFTSLVKRTHFGYRLSFVINSFEDLRSIGQSKSVSLNDLQPVQNHDIRLVFLFCGVGTVWKGMCKEMLKASTPFQRKFAEIDNELQSYTNFSIREIAENPPETLTSDPFIGPLLIFASQISLFNVWKTLGIKPDSIIGQSVGEVAAAHASGCLSLKDAVKLIYYRSFLSAKFSGGSMLVIGKCQMKKIKQLCNEYKGAICIAVFSSKTACVVSGDKDAVDEVKTRIRKSMPECLLKELDVGCAYHSHHMDEACRMIEEKIFDIGSKKPDIPIISTVTGREIVGEEMTTPAYWTKNLRNPVLLKDAVIKVVKDNAKTFIIEVGPKPVVKAHLKNITNLEVISVPTMNQPSEHKVFLQALSTLYNAGISINWTELFSQEQQTVDIPRYKFNREGLLVGAVSLKAGLRLELDNKGGHSFVSSMPLSKGFRVDLNPHNAPYIYEHSVQGRLIAPGALHGEIGFAVAKEVFHIPFTYIKLSLNFVRPLAIVKDQTIELQVHLTDDSNFFIKRKKDTVCKGSIQEKMPTKSKRIDIEEIKTRCTKTVQKSTFYETLGLLGFKYGHSLSVIGACFVSEHEFIAEMEFQESIFKTFNSYSIHPSVLDGALQTLALIYLSFKDSEKPKKPIPVRIGELTVHRQMERRMTVIGRLREIDVSGAVIDLLICDSCGYIFAEVNKFEVRDTTKQNTRHQADDSLYLTKWKRIKVVRMSEKETTLPESALAITLNVESKQLIKAAFDVKHVVALPFDYTISPTEIMEVLFKYIEDKFGTFKEVSEVIFLPGLFCKSTDMKSEKIFVSSKTSCIILMHFLQRLAADSIFDIPFYVITKQTQMKTKDFLGNPWYNVIGSELWGMTRCIMRERMFSKIYLLDFEIDQDIKHIVEVVQHTKIGTMQNVAEFKIENGQIYQNQICKFHYTEPKSRINSYSETEVLEIRSCNDCRKDNLWLVPRLSTELSDRPTDSVIIKVTTGLGTSQWLPLRTEEIFEADPWVQEEMNGHQKLFLETSGVIKFCDDHLIESKSFYFSRGLLKFSKTEEYITCMPVIAANIVDVPKACIIPKALFPSYIPGLLLEVFMIFLMAAEIDEALPVLLYYDTALRIRIELIESILISSKKKIKHVNLIDKIGDLRTNGRFQVILLTKNTNILEKVLTTVSRMGCKVILYSCFVARSTEMKILQRFQNLSLKIINCNKVFCKDTVSVILKKITVWAKMKKNQTMLADSISTNANTYDTGDVFSFLNQSENNSVYRVPTFQVHCSTQQLFRKHAVYVIIGGLTGLGWEMATTIAMSGGGNILLLGRSKPDRRKQSEIDAIADSHTCIIEYFHADVSDFHSISGTFTKIKTKFPDCPIKGVFNGAAVVDDGLLPSMTEEKFDKVLRPKILGTWNLHLVTKDLSLDYFVLHSSITASFGNAGQTNYGAGNSFKDVTAFHRRALGLSGQTINWGALKLGLVNERVENHLRAQGIIALEKDLIIKCFVKSLYLDVEQLICAEVDWNNTMRVSSDMPHLFAKLEPVLHELSLLETVRQSVKENMSIPIIGIEDLRKQSLSERKVCLLDIVCKLSAEACAVELSIVKPKTTLSSLGLDSMKAMAFINAINKHVSCSIPVIAVLEEDATPLSIVRLMLDQLQQKHGLKNEEVNGNPHEEGINEDVVMTNVRVTYQAENGKSSNIQLLIKNGTGPPQLHWFNDIVDMRLKYSDIVSVHRGQNSGYELIKIRTNRNREHVFKSTDIDKMDLLLKELDGKLGSVNESTDL